MMIITIIIVITTIIIIIIIIISIVITIIIIIIEACNDSSADGVHNSPTRATEPLTPICNIIVVYYLLSYRLCFTHF